MSKNNQSGANFDRLFGVTEDPVGRGVSGLMLLDPARIETGAQPRTQFEEGPLNELANSIRERREKNEGIEATGFLQPLLVTAGENNSYRLIAGERRLRAALRLELPFVPAVVVAENPRETLANQLVENLQRAGLNPLEEARAFAAWMEETGLSVREAAQAVGKDKNYISNRVRLLKMGEDVQQMVSQRADALVHAQLIERVQNPEQRAELIQAVSLRGISVAELKQQLKTAPEDEKTAVSLRRDTSPNEATDSRSRSSNAEESGEESLSYSEMMRRMTRLLDEWPGLKNPGKREKTALIKNLDALTQKLAELRQQLES